MPLEFIVNGKVVKADVLQAQKAAAPKKRGVDVGKPDAWHKGWIVEGHPPGHREECKRLADDACALWARKSKKERNKAFSEGLREPKPWDESAWVAKATRRRVRLRPFEVASAAEELKAMAEREGWEFVRVVRLHKGEVPAEPLW